mmetsp:Transcript_13853/g.38068  ORF Transcript_13853/g.38068 Transcript_13853/m.38068 type:complete len:219 (-) Transcript_13853:34-690(-)
MQSMRSECSRSNVRAGTDGARLGRGGGTSCHTSCSYHNPQLCCHLISPHVRPPRSFPSNHYHTTNRCHRHRIRRLDHHRCRPPILHSLHLLRQLRRQLLPPVVGLAGILSDDRCLAMSAIAMMIATATTSRNVPKPPCHRSPCRFAARRTVSHRRRRWHTVGTCHDRCSILADTVRGTHDCKMDHQTSTASGSCPCCGLGCGRPHIPDARSHPCHLRH